MNIHLQQPVVRRGPAVSEAQAVVFMVHGRDQTTEYVLNLVDRIQLPDVHYVAPQAAQNSWYPVGFMKEIAENEPYLSYALDCYEQRISELVAEGIPKSKIVLLGFSQGACLTAEFAVRRPERYGGIIVYTGGVIGPDGTKWNSQGSFQNTPVFLGSSDVDEWVPEQRIHDTAAIFNKLGAQTKTVIYKGMGHEINDDEIDFARELIRNVKG
ncbi:dienelactone hydrolase family protein [Alkalihalobacillus oceani]|uniref:Dienelactone hydrolase family protein n=1 Tax=Halalkalibacter oceani TaxID=1653776 RepID=A0A9X2DQP5_9BACI|nr:dienelactone hydrolase family protein [Halalkalibacter oceani]MCM3713368.1 dienelactone hydrolase family protein [Halalkalibacter oceani]